MLLTYCTAERLTMLVAQWLAVLATAVAAQSSSESTASVTPSSTSTPPVTTANADLELIAQRRRADLATFATPARVELLPTWLAAQGEDGRWSDVDYRMGCEARKLPSVGDGHAHHRTRKLAYSGALDSCDHHGLRLVWSEPVVIRLH